MQAYMIWRPTPGTTPQALATLDVREGRISLRAVSEPGLEEGLRSLLTRPTLTHWEDVRQETEAGHEQRLERKPVKPGEAHYLAAFQQTLARELGLRMIPLPPAQV